jgi:hypothetical protein
VVSVVACDVRVFNKLRSPTLALRRAIRSLGPQHPHSDTILCSFVLLPSCLCELSDDPAVLLCMIAQAQTLMYPARARLCTTTTYGEDLASSSVLSAVPLGLPLLVGRDE